MPAYSATTALTAQPPSNSGNVTQVPIFHLDMSAYCPALAPVTSTSAVSQLVAAPKVAAPKTNKTTAKAKVFMMQKDSTLTFNIKKLSNLYGYETVIRGTNDIEILRDTSIKLTDDYQADLAALTKGYPVHIDLYEGNRVAVVSILNN